MDRMRVASDVGGTFTDSVAYDPDTGRLSVSKVSTTPANRAEGTVAGLRRALQLQQRIGADVAYVGHGMTTATNAVIQRKGARTAFITNEGFRDILLIGRQNRPSLYDLSVVRQEQIVPRERCYTVRGRIDAGGNEIVPLDEAGLREIAAALRADRIEAVAVTLLHAYANPAHERRAAELLRAELPGVVVCISTEVLSEFREFERASVTALNAFLVPLMDRYLSSLVSLLESSEGLGLNGGTPVMVMEAAGGVMTVESARDKPVHTVLSGPAGGVVAASHVAAACGVADLITMDIGGTSTDISLIRGGRPAVTREAKLEEMPIRLPVVDINAIGAGGGSIAWIDDGGALRVGPRSAEAVPGPACYRRGGTEPTVSDANLVLGRLGAATRLGGDMTLDIDAARRVIEARIAAPLGIDVIEAAAGILRVAHANIARGMRVVSVERGHDPRDFVLVPFGGAGPMHGTPVARDLGMRQLLLPPNPGILCAFGLLVSDLRHDLLETHVRELAGFEFDEAGPILQRLQASAGQLLARDGVPADRRLVELRADLRYVGQSFELAVAIDPPTAAGWDALKTRFHEEHRQRFGHADARAAIEVVTLAATGWGKVDPPRLAALEQGGASAQAALDGTRPVYYEAGALRGGGDWHDTPVYDRGRLRAGNVVTGPAIIEEISSTTVLYPGDVAKVHATGALFVEVKP
ncbi:MAG: hydantoinase/oxoprolinase family protein [Lautropia sp.]